MKTLFTQTRWIWANKAKAEAVRTLGKQWRVGSLVYRNMGYKSGRSLIDWYAAAFTILSQDTLKPNVFAPSRPPSRVSIREAHPSTELAVG